MIKLHRLFFDQGNSSTRPKILDPILVSMTDQIMPERLRTRTQQANNCRKSNEEEKIMPIKVEKTIKSEERPLLDVGEFESEEKLQQNILEHYKGLSPQKEKY